MQHAIIRLPKEQWQGAILPIGYTAEEYYQVDIDRQCDGFAVSIRKTALAQAIRHTPDEYDFPDRLYAEHWPAACAWGILCDGKLAAAIETCPEEWSNRLRVTELWVDEPYRKQGIGHALLEVARKQSAAENRRAIILETRSCNVNAIGFYLHEGFTLIGLDACCYSNCDLERKEVRLEMGWFPPQQKQYSLL